MEGQIDMIKLRTELSGTEQNIVNKWKDDNLIILDSIDNICYLLSMNGNIKFSDCFGIPSTFFESNQKYVLAIPNKVIKYYKYYLLENKGEEGEWYVGEKYLNGNIEFYKCCKNLEEAFQSL